MLDESSPLNNQKLIIQRGNNAVLELRANPDALSLTSVHCFSSEADALAHFSTPANNFLSSSPSPPLARRPEKPSLPTESQNLPFFARWFDFSLINPIERQAVPEFFQEKPSKSPEVYQQMRNFIVRLYWQNPKAYLTVSACRRALRGDICAVYRLHAFLEHWGLINFCYKPAALGWSTLAAGNRWYPTFVRQDASPQADRSEYLDDFSSVSPSLAFGPDAAPPCRLGSIFCPTALITRLFALAGEARPQCTRCQKLVGEKWHVKNFNAEMRRKGLDTTFIACTNCFESENFPIFYSKPDFTLATVFDFFHTAEEELTIEHLVRVLHVVEKSADIGSAVESLKAAFPSHTEGALTAQLLRALQSIDRVGHPPTTTTRYNQLNFHSRLDAAFSEKLSGLTTILDPATPASSGQADETSHLPSEQERVTRSALVEGLVAKVELKLRFLEEFAKILQQERQTLRLTPHPTFD